MLALALGAVGIYRVVAYFVGRRTMRPVVVGAVVGLAGAIGVSRVLSSVLFGVSPFDALGIGAAALFVLAVAFAAGWLPPGRSATRRPPLAALHYE